MRDQSYCVDKIRNGGREIGSARDVPSSPRRASRVRHGFSGRRGETVRRRRINVLTRPRRYERAHVDVEVYKDTAKSFIVIALDSVSGGRSRGTRSSTTSSSPTHLATRRTWFLLSLLSLCAFTYIILFFLSLSLSTACIVSLQNSHILSVLFVNS